MNSWWSFFKKIYTDGYIIEINTDVHVSHIHVLAMATEKDQNWRYQ